MNGFLFENEGFCPCCNQNTVFRAKKEWLRDHYLCEKCHSIPRERALMKVIEMYCPNWKNFVIHESSPAQRGTSLRLKSECKYYVESQYWLEKEPGRKYDSVYNINLEQQKFKNNCFDLVVTQDVFEHIYDPRKALREIARTLKPGGLHICTVPLVNKEKSTEKWSVMKNGKVFFMKKPEYHSSATKPNDSPVAFHYGYDFCHLIQKWSGMYASMVYIDDINYGIRAEYIEVLAMKKPESNFRQKFNEWIGKK